MQRNMIDPVYQENGEAYSPAYSEHVSIIHLHGCMLFFFSLSETETGFKMKDIFCGLQKLCKLICMTFKHKRQQQPQQQKT